MTQLSRRQALILFSLLTSGSCKRSTGHDESPLAGQSRRRVADSLLPIPLRDVQLGGYLGRKLGLCIRNRILAQNPEKLVEPFRHRGERQCWQNEFWGKWFLSAAAACEYRRDQDCRDRLRRSVHEILATQTPDGYIGNYAPDARLKSWDVWGRKYTLLGLLAWFDMTSDSAALEGARRLADHLLTEVGPGKADIVRLGLYRGMASSSVLEPVVQLYRRTNDDRYLQFAEYIVSRWSSPQGPRLIEKARVPVAERFPRPKKWWSWENGEKAYEMMSCYAGLLELYRETGVPACLSAALQTFESIRDTEINVAGSGSAEECWYGGKARQTQPAHHTMETCVAASWMQLCHHLLRITGDSRFADEIERTAYNALLAAMTPDGSSFAMYGSLEGIRELGPAQCGMQMSCCLANGPRGLMLLPQTAVMMSAEGPVVNLYCQGVWRFHLPSGTTCRLEVKTDYPSSGQVDIVLRPARPESFPLRLRIPAWSVATSLAINGSQVNFRPGTYAVLRRHWKPGDRVRLRLDMRGRILRLGQYAAVVRGPVVLARDIRLGQPAIAERVAGLPGDYVSLGSVPAPPGIEMAFAAGNGLLLCDYASAGSSWDSRSRFRVWMPSSTAHFSSRLLCGGDKLHHSHVETRISACPDTCSHRLFRRAPRAGQWAGENAADGLEQLEQVPL